MKLRILVAAGIGAVVLTASGVAMATARTSSPHTTAKACVTSNGDLKLVQRNRCPRGSSSFTALAKGGPGTALGYAHIESGDVFDPSHSYNVAASNVVTLGNGWICFTGLKFTPHTAAVTVDYNGLLNGQIPQATLKFPTQPDLCGLTSAQAQVFTGLVTPGGQTSGTQLGFYIVFY